MNTETLEGMKTSRTRVVVCAVDLSEYSLPVIEHALDEAHRLADVDLHFVHVVEHTKTLFAQAGIDSLEVARAEAALQTLVAESLPAFEDANLGAQRKVRFHTRVGIPDEEIVELCHEARADRLVVGRHGARIRRGKMGGIASRVLESAPCTVHVVRLTDYEGADEDRAQCKLCIDTREQSGGEQWFCREHSEGRVPRLMESVGVSSPVPGWGIF